MLFWALGEVGFGRCYLGRWPILIDSGLADRGLADNTKHYILVGHTNTNGWDWPTYLCWPTNASQHMHRMFLAKNGRSMHHICRPTFASANTLCRPRWCRPKLTSPSVVRNHPKWGGCSLFEMRLFIDTFSVQIKTVTVQVKVCWDRMKKGCGDNLSTDNSSTDFSSPPTTHRHAENWQLIHFNSSTMTTHRQLG